MVGREHFYFTLPSGVGEREFLASLLKRIYLNSADIPKEIVLPEDVEEGELIADWLTGRRGGKVILVFPLRGERAKLIGMAKENAQLLLDELLQELAAHVVPRARVDPGLLEYLLGLLLPHGETMPPVQEPKAQNAPLF